MHALKRLIDFLASLVVLILFSPLILVTALLILTASGPPVLFRQERPGLDEKPFTLFKFRTMREVFDNSGQLLPDGERLTGIGKFLRKLSLDELPQMINVLKGEMSLVGPRPLLMRYLPLYNEEQRKRHRVKPGITGWAQVNGRNALTWEEKFQLDIWYVENQSLGLDLKILLMTVLKLFKREGISADGHATMPAFTGSPAPGTETGPDLENTDDSTKG